MSRHPTDRDADRLDALEMRFTEQERVIEDLGAAVTSRWTAIEVLRRQVNRLLDHLADAERRLPAEPDPPPRHY